MPELPSPPPFSLGPDGYFRRNGRPFYPSGVNYWPSSCGVEMWSIWPESEIRRDLALLSQLGLNTIRFFLIWRDFEPRRGEYDRTVWRRLGHLLEWIRQEGLTAQPTLLVGGMSGGLIWPSWKTDSVFADPNTVDAFADFTREASSTMAAHSEIIQAIDLGNEICNLPDSRSLDHELIHQWCSQIGAIVKSELPLTPLTIGNEQSQVLYDGPWRLGHQGPLDFFCMHGYPVPEWHTVPFDGMADPVGQQLLPAYTRIARRFGPVMVQEFGSILTGGIAEQETYFQAVLPACAAAGANGFLWWCFRDIHAGIEPYESIGMEKRLGLVDASGKVKRGLEGVLEFMQNFARSGPAQSPNKPEVHLLLPDPYYSNPLWARGNRLERHAPRLIAAEALFRELGWRTSYCSPSDLPEGRMVYNPGAVLAESQATTILNWVQNGGQYSTSGILWNSWGPAHCALLGGEPVDLRRSGKVETRWNHDVRSLLTTNSWLIVRLDSSARSHILATCNDQPCAWSVQHGSGMSMVCLPSIEETWLDARRENCLARQLAQSLRDLLPSVISNTGK